MSIESALMSFTQFTLMLTAHITIAQNQERNIATILNRTIHFIWILPVFHQCPFCVPESHIYLLFIFSLDNSSVKKIFFMILTFLKSTGHYHMEYPSIWFVFSCLEWGYVCLLGARIPKKLVMSFSCTKSRGS